MDVTASKNSSEANIRFTIQRIQEIQTKASHNLEYVWVPCGLVRWYSVCLCLCVFAYLCVYVVCARVGVSG